MDIHGLLRTKDYNFSKDIDKRSVFRSRIPNIPCSVQRHRSNPDLYQGEKDASEYSGGWE